MRVTVTIKGTSTKPPATRNHIANMASKLLEPVLHPRDTVSYMPNV